MNQIIETIKSRRSIRRYLPEQIKDEELNLILEAAIYAPSGHNDQPWHFTVIQNKELIDYISQRTKELMVNASTDWIAKMGSSEKYHLLHNAPTVIIVSGVSNPNPELPYSPIADCSAAIQNMLLAAHSIGIASCWIGLTSFLFEREEEVKRLNLNIPEGYTPLFAVTLGYSSLSKNPTALERKSSVINYIK
ncbi:nitroreductase family protein [Fonticella tunisiensis]|uniref:Nitroreductase n=1 Tax=Fonticella tunisiensis TaxID=1096341 RepID=A0A4R7KPB1_9CLOT|nr:nitroreductase family protein [Fonticella tunisiensis]TDT60960.1 nitroreductase [Fonticella tunisiensis]